MVCKEMPFVHGCQSLSKFQHDRITDQSAEAIVLMRHHVKNISKANRIMLISTCHYQKHMHHPPNKTETQQCILQCQCHSNVRDPSDPDCMSNGQGGELDDHCHLSTTMEEHICNLLDQNVHHARTSANLHWDTAIDQAIML